MAKHEFRIERDSMGPVKVPARAYYGASTQRAVANFPISGYRFQRAFIRALGLVKEAAAIANQELGLLPADIAGAIQRASREVAAGRFDKQFVVDVFQTGSGTSTNMNANEVIARRATELLKGRRRARIHPNDQVNLGQSSNDVIPSALHIAARESVSGELMPALEGLLGALSSKAREFAQVIKVGRTHLQDATPVSLGQEFSGWARQIELAMERLRFATAGLSELAMGGTAVGTGLNTHPEFGRRVADLISRRTGLDFREALDHFEAQGARDAVLAVSSALRGLAIALTKIAGDIRLLASGPRSGLAEITLPALQPGSSIMPGKINPVMAEALAQAAAYVVGADASVAFSVQAGVLELNTMMPLIVYQLLESIRLTAAAVSAFSRRCVVGIRANHQRCGDMAERSLAMATALVPVLGYDQAGKLANEAFASGRSVREVVLRSGVLSRREVKRLLDPARMTRPERD